MEFPRHCHKPEGLFVVVTNAEQYEQVIANGWLDQPPAHVEKAVEVRFIDAIGAVVDETPAEDAPKRGRKAKKD